MEIAILILVLMALTYTAIVVAEEKRAWRENARLLQLGRFRFPVPSWWKQTPLKQEKVTFTGSNWQGMFRLLPPNQQSLQKSLAGEIAAQQIVFDPDSTLHHLPTSKKFVRRVRMEGTATEKEENRIYFDAFLLECPQTGQRLYGESKSSVLSGPLEGPWFEECLNNCYAVPLDGK